jgi:hypothetical protein
MITTILPTRNTEWGFFGTIDRIEHDLAADAPKAWTLASESIAAATGVSPEGVRDFLDSRHGRHFADDVANALARGDTLKDAIDDAVARWMGWRIDRRTSRDTGIPAGLPYLTGFATHFEILSDA